MSAAEVLAAALTDGWGGSTALPLGDYLAALAWRQDIEVPADVRRLAACLAPLAAAYPATSPWLTNGGWSDRGVLTDADLADLFEAGILHRQAVERAGATYIEIASERALRGLL